MAKNDSMVPTNDYIFKRIFGHIGNEEITKGLISAIINKEVQNVKLDETPILEKDIRDDKVGILDVRARIDGEVQCNIEMQIVQSDNIERRLMFYWSKLYSGDIKEGEDYEKLNKTIVILIADFELDSIKEIEKYHTKWQIREEEYGKIVLTDVLEIHIIELSKLMDRLKNKGIDEKDKVMLWSIFIKNPEKIGENAMSENEDIKKAKEELDKIKQDKRERYLAELRDKHIRDTKAVEKYGYKKGIEEGTKMAKEEIKKAEEERKEAEEKIKKVEKKQKTIILNMYNKKIDIDTICEVVELSKEEVKKIIELKEQ